MVKQEPNKTLMMLEKISTEDLLEIAQDWADAKYDGHLTIMKFTTNWRAVFGPTPDSREEIKNMMPGESLRDVLISILRTEGFPC